MLALAARPSDYVLEYRFNLTVADRGKERFPLGRGSKQPTTAARGDTSRDVERAGAPVGDRRPSRSEVRRVAKTSDPAMPEARD